MNFFIINKENFSNEKHLGDGIPITLMGLVFKKISTKFPTLDTTFKHSFVLVDTSINIVQQPELDIFQLNKTTNLIVAKFNHSFELQLNNDSRFFSSNELNLISSSTPIENISNKDKSKMSQEELAFHWLKTNGIGRSAKSICFQIFPNVLDFFEKETDEKFDFNHPYDTDDFSRCLNITKELNLSDTQIKSLASISEPWKNLVENWENLDSLMNSKKYDEAYSLIKKCVDIPVKNKNQP